MRHRTKSDKWVRKAASRHKQGNRSDNTFDSACGGGEGTPSEHFKARVSRSNRSNKCSYVCTVTRKKLKTSSNHGRLKTSKLTNTGYTSKPWEDSKTGKTRFLIIPQTPWRHWEAQPPQRAVHFRSYLASEVCKYLAANDDQSCHSTNRPWSLSYHTTEIKGATTGAET